MNKKIVLGITIAIVTIAVSVAGVKTILGDKAAEIPGEEHTEKALNIQETSKSTSTTPQPSESKTTESTESGP